MLPGPRLDQAPSDDASVVEEIPWPASAARDGRTVRRAVEYCGMVSIWRRAVRYRSTGTAFWPAGASLRRRYSMASAGSSWRGDSFFDLLELRPHGGRRRRLSGRRGRRGGSGLRSGGQSQEHAEGKARHGMEPASIRSQHHSILLAKESQA